MDYAICVYILDCRRSKPRSYSSQSLTHPALKKLQNKNAAIGHNFAGKLEPAHAKRQAMVIQLSDCGHLHEYMLQPLAWHRGPCRLARANPPPVTKRRGVVCERIKIFRNSGSSVAPFAKSARRRCGSPASSLTSRLKDTHKNVQGSQDYLQIQTMLRRNTLQQNSVVQWSKVRREKFLDHRYSA